MKKIFLSILTVATVAACNKAEVIDQNPGEAIAFGEAFVDNITRAASDPSYGTDNALTSFKVWGTVNNTSATPVAIFAGDEVKNSNGTTTATYGDAWFCDNTQYWIYGVTYNFAAVVNGTVPENGLTNGLPTTINYTADGKTDLLYAEQKNVVRMSTDTDKLVRFTFSHLLSKVKFTATNTTTGNSNYTFQITDLTITTPASGTATIANSKATWSSNGTTSTAFSFNEKTGITATECEEEKLVIPSTHTTLTATFSINWYYGDDLISTESNKTASASNVTLDAGKAYNFNISYGLNDKIEFTVTAAPSWSGDTTTDHTL